MSFAPYSLIHPSLNSLLPLKKRRKNILDGSVYEGEWKNDEKHGQGRFIRALGTIQVEHILC